MSQKPKTSPSEYGLLTEDVCLLYKKAARAEALTSTILNTYQLDGSVDDHLSDLLVEHLSDICQVLAGSCDNVTMDDLPF